ncbi:MAG: sigma-70 family RNA polymerase sigma factor [Candidatus Ratteibacteria bacterium]
MEQNNPLDFENIVHQEAKKVFNLAYRLCGNQEEAKDISQETFVRAYEHFDRFQGNSRVFTYLYRVTFNVWKNRLRHRSRHPIFSIHSPDPEKPDFSPADSKPTPAQAFELDERAGLVRVCLESLDPTSRLIIILRDMEGRSYEEISRIMKCRLGTVKSRLARARTDLREQIRPYLERMRK